MRYKTDVKFSIAPFTEEEEKEVGVFISYSHKDNDIFHQIIDALSEHVNVLSDLKIESGTEDFTDKIKEMMNKATCGIVILSEHITPWVMYEVATLASKNKKVYMFGTGEIPSVFSQFEHIENINELVEKVKDEKLFNDLLENETSIVTIKDFNNKVLPNIGHVNLRITVPGLSTLPKNSYQFSYIIPGLYKTEVEVFENDKICYKNGASLEESFCPYFEKYKCCPYAKDIVNSGHVEAVILNKIYNSTSVNGDFVEFILPVSHEYGVTFKCFVDIKDFTIREVMKTILFDAGIISQDESNSGVADRIYFCLPKKPLKGLYKSYNKAGFYNNYLCPGVLEG